MMYIVVARKVADAAKIVSVENGNNLGEAAFFPATLQVPPTSLSCISLKRENTESAQMRSKLRLRGLIYTRR